MLKFKLFHVGRRNARFSVLDMYFFFYIGSPEWCHSDAETCSSWTFL